MTEAWRGWTVVLASVCAIGAGSRAATVAGTAPAPRSADPAASGGAGPSASAPKPRLTFAEALARGLEHNLGTRRADEALRAAEGAGRLARSALLPDVAATLAGAREEINLEAYGFPVQPGESPVVGPFNVADARLQLRQTLFDYSAVEQARAGRRGVDAARSARRDARENVAYLCASLYVQAAIGSRRIDEAQAQLRTAEALYRRAVNLKEAGTAAGIEVLRAQVQQHTQRQRVIVYENEYAKAKLALAQAIDLPLEQDFELADGVVYAPAATATLEESLGQAYGARPDLQQLEFEIAAAAATRRAASATRLPSLHLNADYGWIGPSFPLAERTFTVAAGLVLPVFEAGRSGARTLQADAALSELRARRDDLRSRIELQVRSAFLDVRAADERVQVAGAAVELATEQLKEAQDRFAAGVANNLEVVQAQDALAATTDNYLSALLAHDLAKLALARALGVAEATAAQCCGGRS